MERVRVSSSNLKDVGYSFEQKVLEVGFLNGSVYQYFDVPEDEYSGLMEADSKGGYLDEHIKKGGYRYKKVR